MRQAIRVYAIVALAVAVMLLAAWWMAPARLVRQPGWIAVIVLAMLAANLYALEATVLLFSRNSVVARGLASLQPQMQSIGAVVPVVVLLVALIYALTVLRGRAQAAALAAS